MLFRGIANDSTDIDLRPPTFGDIEQEREHRKLRLAAAYRIFARFGYDHWVAGHITVRDPEYLDHFWVNPFAKNWAKIRASDLLLVDSDGTVVRGEGALNAAAFAIHSAIHHARPDVVAAAHAHTPHGQAWSVTGNLIEPITQDACAFYEDLGIFDEYSGVVYDTNEGGRIADALGTRKAVILRHHGLLTVGDSVDEAAFWLHLLEQVCRTHLLLSVNGNLGQLKTMGPEMARKAHEQVGQHLHGWLGFQPLWTRVIDEDPTFLT
jgi:ribulose-5-phosphate 4-epimerase/fuculose-1-phosphate aldolase